MVGINEMMSRSPVQNTILNENQEINEYSQTSNGRESPGLMQLEWPGLQVLLLVINYRVFMAGPSSNLAARPAWAREAMTFLVVFLSLLSPRSRWILSIPGFLLPARLHQLISVRNNWPFIPSPHPILQLKFHFPFNHWTNNKIQI